MVGTAGKVALVVAAGAAVGAVAVVLAQKKSQKVGSISLAVSPTSGLQFVTLFNVYAEVIDNTGAPVVGQIVVVQGPWGVVAGKTDATGMYSALTPPAIVTGPTNVFAICGGVISNTVTLAISPLL
jgi:hypothetical protein